MNYANLPQASSRRFRISSSRWSAAPFTTATVWRSGSSAEPTRDSTKRARSFQCAARVCLKCVAENARAAKIFTISRRSCGRSECCRRSRFFAMAHSKQAALGFRVHSGWTALVAVCLEKGAPVVLARQRVHLVETFTYEFRQPYHTAEKMLLGRAREFILRMQAEARRLAYRAIRNFQSSLQEQGLNPPDWAIPWPLANPLPRLKKFFRLNV